MELKRGEVFDYPGPIYVPMARDQYDEILKAVALIYPHNVEAGHRRVVALHVLERYGAHRLTPRLTLTSAEADDVKNHYMALYADALMLDRGPSPAPETPPAPEPKANGRAAKADKS